MPARDVSLSLSTFITDKEVSNTLSVSKEWCEVRHGLSTALFYACDSTATIARSKRDPSFIMETEKSIGLLTANRQSRLCRLRAVRGL